VIGSKSVKLSGAAMPNLAFIDARFPDPALAKDQIATRLKAHLRNLIAARRALNAEHTP
jgi:hypothetical protein